MKYLLMISIPLLLMSCSSVQVINDKFDNSTLVKLESNDLSFVRIDGQITLKKLIFSKTNNSGSLSDIKLFCKFEGHEGQLLEGNTIELNTDGIIHKINLLEARLGSYEEETSNSLSIFKRIGAFTFSDSTRSNVNVIAMESILSNDVQEAISRSKSLMLRIYTKNIDGISKNTFEASAQILRDMKKFIKYAPAR